MTIKSRFVCEKCNVEFDHAQECIEHEKTCGEGVETFTCQCCGETKEWEAESLENIPNNNTSHHLDLGVFGYGALPLQNYENIKVDVCNKCLNLWLESFSIKTWETDEWGK